MAWPGIHDVGTEALQTLFCEGGFKGSALGGFNQSRKKKLLHASVYVDPSEIVSHLVGLKDVPVLSYARRGPAGEITVEQAEPSLVCRRCGQRAWVKDRPVVSYVDLPFGGVPITLRWRKHRLVCPNDRCPQSTFTLGDHRISAVGCMLTTRAAKWVVKQMGGGQPSAIRRRSSAAAGTPRVAFGFTNFKNFRIRALLYAGKPNWRVLDSIVVT